MNNFHLKGHIAFPFYGSGEMLPNWLFKILIGDPEHSNGLAKYAPYPLRKIEASLLNEDFNVLTVCPEYLHNYISDAKILGIHTVDPLGYGSKPYFFDVIKGAEHYSINFLKELIELPSVKEARSRGLKIIIGGEGAWQLRKFPQSDLSSNVDHVIIGEGDIITPRICRDILNRKKVPKYIESSKKDSPDIDKISTIRNASNFGCIEVGRGCNRNCKFCEVTKSNLRWYTFDMIEKELMVNQNQGIKNGMIHAEDVLLFGQQGFIPDDKKMIKLFKLIYRHYEEFIITHFTLAAVLANKNLFKKLMEIVLEKQDFLMGEAGIETGSIRLMKQTMTGKVLPFKIDNWKNIIKESLDTLQDYNFIPYCSLIIDLPNENSDDVIETLELIDDLKDNQVIFLPSYFTPLGIYTDLDAKKPDISDLDSLRKELVYKCINHNARWINSIAKIILEKDLMYRMLSRIWYTQSKIKGLIS
jgi:radical SAM superfamily enzyme YgiQ (UPF0313 family)